HLGAHAIGAHGGAIHGDLGHGGSGQIFFRGRPPSVQAFSPPSRQDTRSKPCLRNWATALVASRPWASTSTMGLSLGRLFRCDSSVSSGMLRAWGMAPVLN